MSAFITDTDYDSTIHSEILDSLTRGDSTIVEQCENDAIAEMKGYLSVRYDTDAIFSKTGSDRNALVLMYAKDIAVYHMFCVHNPYKISKIRQDRYDRAMEWLKQVAQGNILIADADRLPGEEQKRRANFSIISNPMNDPHF
ncbi:MAG: DUF1320 family protein [Paludibacteraceae bacterium]|nr:DUF1320 family protein [Paludibacteraceae bacterium]